jgi:hydroxylamine reductase
MFCYQCEQTAGGKGCTAMGVCGKDPDVAALQDLLLYAASGVSIHANRAARLGASDAEVDTFVVKALFSTLTNVNFDAQRVAALVIKAAALRDKAKALHDSAAARSGQAAPAINGPAAFVPAGNLQGLISQGRQVGIMSRRAKYGDDLTGLQELLTYGLKGLAAYADHAQILGKRDAGVYAFIHDTLDYLATAKPSVDELLARCLKCGQMNLTVMGLLDAANTGAYGTPVPTEVRVTPVKGKCILVSGHDLKDLADLLEQTAGKGINVYTHGEMLPANGYPGLKKHPHLVGNYGGAWQDQQAEFAAFPGAILMTTNCMQKPRESYIGRIFTSGVVAWPGVRHIGDGNFAPVIAAAQQAPGFAADAAPATTMTGFGHGAVMSVAPAVIEAVKAGKIRRFFLIGGCDGAKSGRNYYTDLAQAVPDDCVILTLACGKYRFNKLPFGDIGGIPRLLDVGQCNDAYSAIQIAVALAKAFNTDVNSLPLNLVLSWYEQKACAILLTLLHLGIKNIRIGPSLPAFVTSPVLDVLVKQFGVKPITTAKEDLKAMLS